MRRPESANDGIMYEVDIHEMVERSKCRTTGKVRFVSQTQANFFIYWLKWKHKKARKKGKKMVKGGQPKQRRSYYCDACKGYHLTRESRSSYERRVKE